MEINQDKVYGYFIQRYGASSVTVNRHTYHQSLIVSPHEIISEWPVHQCADLTSTTCQMLFDLAPDIILIGTGSQQAFPTPLLLSTLGSGGRGVEFMSTPAACRTYNILLGEGRSVVAGLILGV